MNDSDTSTSSSSLDKLVTVIISTSPLPSHPSTAVIDAVLQSHARFCPELVACRRVVVFDGYKTGPTLRLKKGNVTETIAQGYEAYKAQLKQLISGGQSCFGQQETQKLLIGGQRQYAELSVRRTVDGKAVFIEPTKQIGFALGVKAALGLVTTPYVFVQQHDWALCSPLPLPDMLAAMESCSQHDSNVPINYIGLNNKRSMNYSSRVVANDSLLRQLETSILTLHSNDALTVAHHVLKQCTPLFHWLDRPHIARTSTYLTHVFGQGLFSPGDFIEDVLGNVMLAKIRNHVATRNVTMPSDDEMAEFVRTSGWPGCWLYEGIDANSRSLVHLQGRTYIGSTPEMKRRELNVTI
jgi:hypothetical protein